MRLPGIDRLVDFILEKGRNCLVFKKDLRRAYQQFPIDPKDYKFLGFSYQEKFYVDTRCPLGLHTSTMICQHTTRTVVHIFTEQGFLADVYLDDFYGAEYPSLAPQAFSRLGHLFLQLGLDSSPEQDSPPSTSMICLGILVDTAAFTLEVPTTRLEDLLAELTTWQAATFFTRKQLQSLLGKLSFVTACVKPGRIFMARLRELLLLVFASASGRVVTVTPSVLLCSRTYSGGWIFFLGFPAFLLSSRHFGILRTSIFPLMRVFTGRRCLLHRVH